MVVRGVAGKEGKGGQRGSCCFGLSKGAGVEAATGRLRPVDHRRRRLLVIRRPPLLEGSHADHHTHTTYRACLESQRATRP